MDADLSERLGALAGMAASVAVGVPILIDTLRADAEPPVLALGPWWVCYLGYLVVFALLSQGPIDRRPWLSDPLLLIVQAAAGIGATVLSPGYGWGTVLLVVTAATAAYVWSAAATALLLALQAVVVAAVVTAADLGAGEAALSAVVYTSFQVFAVLVVRSQRRDAAARATLAETNAQLQAATALLEGSGRTAERLRIARDLHDLVGHQLTALSLELEAATHAPPEETQHVARARAIARSLLGDVRQVVGELRGPPPSLADALHALTADLPRLEVDVVIASDVEADDATTVALVRCAQELVTNTLRHADASHLRLEVARGEDGGLRMTAQDDGRGCAELRPGNGLRGVRERIAALGGTVGFATAPGRGMEVVAEVPGR